VFWRLTDAVVIHNGSWWIKNKLILYKIYKQGHVDLLQSGEPNKNPDFLKFISFAPGPGSSFVDHL